MKRFTSSILLAVACLTVSAQYITQADGTTYTLSSLSQMAESGVSRQVDAGKTIYTITQDVTISASDAFQIEGGVEVRMADGVRFTIEGVADLDAAERVLVTRASETDAPYGFWIADDTQTATLRNFDFEYAGVHCWTTTGMNVLDCTFRYHNGVSSSSAVLHLGTTGSRYVVKGCTFEYNRYAAIAGAANFINPLLIEDNVFRCNTTSNDKKPQLNLTAADSVIVRNNVIIGSPDNTQVGGIAVANLMAGTGYYTLIEGNTVEDNSYGLTCMAPMEAIIRNNTFKNNIHCTDSLNFGMGISLYDPYSKLDAMLTGNHIEGGTYGITVVYCHEVNLGKTEVAETADDYNPGLNVFKNNGWGGTHYDLYNNSPYTIYAQGNTWNVAEQTQEAIEEVIFHKNDADGYGEVIYWPAASTTAISPVQNSTSDDAWYNFNGTRTSKPTQRGIYIHNGKKVVF